MARKSRQLSDGQMPLAALVRVERAHDVRTLRVCPECRCLGNADAMVQVTGEYFHGRCFVARFGEPALLDLPQTMSGRLTVADIGEGAMHRLLARHCRPRRRRARRNRSLAAI